MPELKVLLVGHACSPGLGSEPGLTWNWAWHLAEHHQVWVIAHPLHRAAVESVTRQHRQRAPTMVWVDLPTWANPWDPARGERGIRLHYMLWQRAALAQARRLHATQQFDIVHHVSWATVNAPPALWRLGIPFVWGPLGGGQAAPLRFGRYLGLGGSVGEAARTLRRHLMPFLPSLRRTAANSAFVLATNRETAAILYRAGARHVELFYDNGVVPNQFIPRRRARTVGDRLELMWVGRLEPRKGLPLALEAMAQVSDLPIRLSVAGDGPLRSRYERRAAALGLSETVEFLGFVPRTRLLSDLYASSDALLFTSLQDSAGSVVLEAMAAGLPVIGLDHQGAGMVMPEESAIKVPVTSPDATVRGLAAGIRKMADSPELACRMGEAARDHASSETWSRRIARMDQLYQQCLELGHDRAWVSPNDRKGSLLPNAPT
jgi:glycosyltransferase involved in cell wall biosynthesis